MDAEEMIRVWAARELDVPVELVASVRFAHSDGWQDDDSGTYWPEENHAVVSLWSEDPADRRVSMQRKKQISMDEGVEGFHFLLQRILDANR